MDALLGDKTTYSHEGVEVTQRDPWPSTDMVSKEVAGGLGTLISPPSPACTRPHSTLSYPHLAHITFTFTLILILELPKSTLFHQQHPRLTLLISTIGLQMAGKRPGPMPALRAFRTPGPSSIQSPPLTPSRLVTLSLTFEE